MVGLEELFPAATHALARGQSEALIDNYTGEERLASVLFVGKLEFDFVQLKHEGSLPTAAENVAPVEHPKVLGRFLLLTFVF
jgi:hypothetical protein